MGGGIFVVPCVYEFLLSPPQVDTHDGLRQDLTAAEALIRKQAEEMSDIRSRLLALERPAPLGGWGSGHWEEYQLTTDARVTSC